jgi:phage tail sheath protein FI
VAGLVAGLEKSASSYGALFHPWTMTRDEEGGAIVTSPPDGAIAGTIAARAMARGAWVAPANEPLEGVVALTPEIPRTALQSLQDAAVNVLRQEPAGFVCLDADTLTDDETIRPLNVRRLLILLRRAAIRVGNRYAFEPNDESLARAVKRGFEAMLETLFLRGAFTGRTAGAAFQVTTDQTVNSPQAIDSGRFLAEIRVAPSHPLSFLTIRLMRSGDRTVVEEAR